MASRRIASLLYRRQEARSRSRAVRPAIESLESRVLLTSLPPGFSESVVTGGINRPTAMDFAPDGSGRLFVAEQGGTLGVIVNGQLQATPFVSLNVDSTGERGLLGVAFDLNFATDSYVYVYYTVPGSPAHNRVSRFTASGNVAMPGSEVDLLDIDSLSTDTRHNGGAIHFGPDGKLYIAVGDNKVSSNSQSLSSLKGKILRINPDGSIPTDNPFFSQTTGVDRAIWALGLRNPYTFAFGIDPSGNRRMFINDVGENTWEEIDDGIAGSNYGWPYYEGPSNDPNFRSPLFAYNHNGQPAAITGGTFYDPAVAQFPATYTGVYFFADFLNNWIHIYNPATNSETDFASSLPEGVVDLKVGGDGSLYYLAGPGTGNGEVVQIKYSTPPTGNPPSILQQPASQTVGTGQSVSFSVVAAGMGNLIYQWQRNGRNIPGAVLPTYVLPNVQSSDNGAQFSVMVSNAFGQTSSAAATLTVVVLHQPVPTISTSLTAGRYIAGQPVSFGGGATDAQDGTLAPSALTWQVDLHDASGVHSIVPPTSGIASGSFTPSQTGDPSPSVFYRITLTAVDSLGLRQSTYLDVTPQTANLALSTQPAGFTLSLDGRSQATPGTMLGASGMIHTLLAPAGGIVGGVIYQFAGWSDGNTSAFRNLVFPSADASLTAVYQAVGIVPYVTVQGASSRVRRGTVSSVTLSFSGPLDPSSARSRTSYWLVLPGRDRVFGTRDDRRYRFRSDAYSASSGTVTLVPSVRITSRQTFQVIAVASGSGAMIRDSYGRPIDGNRDGQPGGDFVATFGPGSTVAAFAARRR
jgi:glucose/arabinose dehydrogenase